MLEIELGFQQLKEANTIEEQKKEEKSVSKICREILLTKIVCTISYLYINVRGRRKLITI